MNINELILEDARLDALMLKKEMANSGYITEGVKDFITNTTSKAVSGIKRAYEFVMKKIKEVIEKVLVFKDEHRLILKKAKNAKFQPGVKVKNCIAIPDSSELEIDVIFETRKGIKKERINNIDSLREDELTITEEIFNNAVDFITNIRKYNNEAKKARDSIKELYKSYLEGKKELEDRGLHKSNAGTEGTIKSSIERQLNYIATMMALYTAMEKDSKSIIKAMCKANKSNEKKAEENKGEEKVEESVFTLQDEIDLAILEAELAL